ncbi:hypothetical protein WAI453_002947 [Rhynchosporium graminicola]|uniref:Uncharacterized protein n=1 Tax=Rhynchosporium graminicola TaxID=2792576 RepID=A0A1E1JVX2_9HELO|nr:uncharacterized protein RCO7_02333 [Rhynchosporium commune]
MASLATKSRSTSSLVPSAQSSTPIPAIGTSPEKTSSIPPTGAIAGGAVAGIGILVIGPLIFCFCQKRLQRKALQYNNGQPAMINNGSDHSAFMVKTDEFHQKKAIAAERYYANQPILLSGQKVVKYTSLRTSSPPFSPALPPYQSGQVSPNLNLHEMGSPNL